MKDLPASVEPETGREFPILTRGQRVRLRPPLIELELTSPLGTVVGPDENDGHYRIKLDEPARYYELGVGRDQWEPIEEIVETSDNLDIFDGGRWHEPAWIEGESRKNLDRRRRDL